MGFVVPADEYGDKSQYHLSLVTLNLTKSHPIHLLTPIQDLHGRHVQWLHYNFHVLIQVQQNALNFFIFN